MIIQQTFLLTYLRSFKSINTHILFSLANKKRSFYNILDINTTFSQRDLRKKYLIKARKYHPDHNQQQGAIEEFKLVKQAYQTLKDPTKKLMYDSGVAQIPDQVTPVHDNQVRQGQKYYQNKWYGYKKPSDHDMRDQYYQMKADYFADKPENPIKYVVSFTCIVLALFGYDFISNIDTAKQKERNITREVLDDANPPQETMTKKQKIYKNYLQKRQKMHKVDL